LREGRIAATHGRFSRIR